MGKDNQRFKEKKKKEVVVIQGPYQYKIIKESRKNKQKRKVRH